MCFSKLAKLREGGDTVLIQSIHGVLVEDLSLQALIDSEEWREKHWRGNIGEDSEIMCDA